MKSKKLFLMAKKHNHWLERGLTLDHKDFFGMPTLLLMELFPL